MNSRKKRNKLHNTKFHSPDALKWEAERNASEDYYHYYQLGLHWSKYRECELAIEQFTHLIRLYPTFADAYLQRGYMDSSWVT